MSSEEPQPFIINGAYYNETNSYVPFPSQSDAMLASLQLFHEVPCRIMNLIISTVTHPEFDTKQVTLKSSLDVIKVTEEARLQDRMAVVHRRSLNDDGHMEQTKLPQFALYEVLDIVHAERMERIKILFKGSKATQFFEKIPENDMLSNMSLVHRSWTFPAQKTIGRLVCIRKIVEKTDILSLVEHKAIFGPWTTAVAIDFISNHKYRDVTEFELLKKFEILHRLLLSSPNLTRIYFGNDVPLLATWFNFTVREMVRQNMHLEELTLQSGYWSQMTLFDIDPLFENGSVSDNLRSLNIRGASISDGVRESLSKGSGFTRLRSLRIGYTDSAVSETMLTLLSVLSARSDPHLNSFSIFGGDKATIPVMEKNLSSRQCTSLFGQLTTLHIESDEADHWLQWIFPYCLRLETIAITTIQYSDILWDLLSLLPTTIQSIHIRITETDDPYHLLRTSNRLGELLKIARSPLHSSIQLIALSIPDVYPLNFEQDAELMVENYEKTIRKFRSEMNAACGDAGIVFDFSWSDSCELSDKFVREFETSSEEASSDEASSDGVIN